jgi:hypothetical protein
MEMLNLEGDSLSQSSRILGRGNFFVWRSSPSIAHDVPTHGYAIPLLLSYCRHPIIMPQVSKKDPLTQRMQEKESKRARGTSISP